MISTETAKTVVLVLFGLSILWIVVIIVRNDMQTIIRALIVAALLGLGLYYLNQTKLETLSFTAIKEELFPVQARAYTYRTAGIAITREVPSRPISSRIRGRRSRWP